MVITSDTGLGMGEGGSDSVPSLDFLLQETVLFYVPPPPPPTSNTHTHTHTHTHTGLEFCVKWQHTGGQCRDGLAFHPGRGGRVVGGVAIFTAWCFMRLLTKIKSHYAGPFACFKCLSHPWGEGLEL